ncbi:MAG: hypothetical protein KF793_04825 [Nitrospira sp.]|nr:hypothetical protein [Nitrospira sp.]
MQMIVVLLSLFLWLDGQALTANAASESSGSGKAGANQGLTLDQIGRGLKSAARNVEEEIPKIGPAIGKTFKQVTGSGKDTSTSKEPSQGSKGKK